MHAAFLFNNGFMWRSIISRRLAGKQRIGVTSIESSVAGHPGEDGEHVAAWHEAVRGRALARWRPHAARLPLGAWIAVVALVLMLLLRLIFVPQPKPAANIRSIRIVLLDTAAAEPPLPQPRPLPAHALPLPAPIRAPVLAEPRPTAEQALPTETPVPHIFNTDGSIDLPREDVRTDSMTASFTTPAVSEEALAILHHQRPLKVRPNHFAAQYRSTGAIDAFVDKFGFEKEFVLPWGTHVKCGGLYLFVVAAGSCGWYTPYHHYVPMEHWKPATSLDEE
jgi:hypothetical protein